MQKTEIIDKSQLLDVMGFVLSDSEIELYESYSAMEENLIRIKSSSDFQKYLAERIKNGTLNFGFGIYHPEFGGKILISRIELNPDKCNGKRFRYRLDGWAIIFVQLDLRNGEHEIECRISVNTKKRAEAWHTTNSELGAPELWNWKKVESIARRIIKKIKKTTHNKV